ncbi:hypothetical protein ENBRE01_3487, partial [Enteropsectra breve]
MRKDLRLCSFVMGLLFGGVRTANAQRRTIVRPAQQQQTFTSKIWDVGQAAMNKGGEMFNSWHSQAVEVNKRAEEAKTKKKKKKRDNDGDSDSSDYTDAVLERLVPVPSVFYDD